MQTDFIYSYKWLDLLFEHKNKNYGAYILRRREADRTLVAFLFAIAIFGFIAASVLTADKIYQTYFPANDKVKIKKDDAIKFIEIVLPPKEHPKIEIQKPISHVNPENIIPKVVNEEIKTTEPTKPIADNISQTSNTLTGTPATTDLPPIITTPLPANSGIPHWIDVMPQFPGGFDALHDYLINTIHFPQELAERGISGRVYLEFVVEADGTIGKVNILRGVQNADEFSEEAIRVVKKMPQWTPGIQGGRNVAVWYTIPINFLLK